MKIEDVRQAWNAQADEHNQWPTLSGEEMVEFALELTGRMRRLTVDRTCEVLSEMATELIRGGK